MCSLRLCSPVVLLAAGAVALGACGSSDPVSSSLVIPAPVTTRSASNADANAAAKEAVSHCKRAVVNARSLPGTAKAELLPTCNKMLGLTGAEDPMLRHVICNEVAVDSSEADAVEKRVLKTCEREAS
jgi:hypothetical protein